MTGARPTELTLPLAHRPLAAALGVLGAHNLIQNSFLNERGYVAGNLAASAALIAIARRHGAGWEQLGLNSNSVVAGAKTGIVASLVAAGATVAAMGHPATRRLVGEDRARVGEALSVWRRAVIRFPIGTAFFEEIAFRGVLPALMRGGAVRADVLSAGWFAVWHLIPTARVQGDIAATRDWSHGQRALAAALGSVAAGAGGLGLSLLRRRTGSIFVPWLVHATVNSTAYLAVNRPVSRRTRALHSPRDLATASP